MLMRTVSALAGAVLILAIWFMLQPGGPRGVLVRFGPPQVELSEAYAAPAAEARALNEQRGRESPAR